MSATAVRSETATPPRAVSGEVVLGDLAAVVSLGSRVLLEDLDEGTREEFVLVSSAESNPSEGKISNESPVGRAIEGRHPGDVVAAHAPHGVRHLRIAAIRLLGLVVVLGLAVALGSARASAPPVGPLPKGPVTTIRVQHGLLFALALPRPANGLAWRGARPSDATIARPLDEGELNGNIVFTYRAGHAGTTTVVYALTRDETAKALMARFFRVVVF